MILRIHVFFNDHSVNSNYLDKARVSSNNDHYNQEVIEDLIKNSSVVTQVSKELCEKSLMEAKTQLHPLLHQLELEKLGQRRGFVHAFKRALERAVAERIALWLPCVKVVYKFDAPLGNFMEYWDNTIHLLILVPRLLPLINELAALLDQKMLEQLQHLGWSRFLDSKSIIEIQQVTLKEIHKGVCYGAMFYSLYAAPLQIWPLKGSSISTPEART